MANNTSTMRLTTSLGAAALFLLVSIGSPAQSTGVATGERNRNDTDAPDETAAPVEMAPQTVFEAELGDADVDLFLDGSWQTGLGVALGWAFHEPRGPSGDRVTFPYSFPGMSRTPFFNAVSLTVSLWLYERYYLESTYSGGSQADGGLSLERLSENVNTLLLGYQGRENEFLQSVKIGKGPLSISSYPYLDFARATESTRGLQAEAATENTRHELLLRVEQTEPDSRLYFGLNRVREERVDPVAYLQGRFFVLPDPGVTSLRVYVEHEDGPLDGDDGRTYRRLPLSELAAYSQARGTITLSEPATGRLLVHYEKDGATVGDPSLGTGALVDDIDADGVLDPPATRDFDWNVDDYLGIDFYDATGTETERRNDLQVVIEGREALVIHRPGTFDPFAMYNRYPVESEELAGGGFRARYVRRSTRSDAGFDRPPLAEFDAGPSAVALSGRGESGDPRHHSNRYPFAGTDPSYAALYTQAEARRDARADFEILLQKLEPVSELTVPDDAVPGSVTVLRNGNPDPTFTVDPDEGVVSSPRGVFPDDVIEITYRTYAEGAGIRSVNFAFGNRLFLNEQSTLELATGARWNRESDDFTGRPGESAGHVTGSARYSFEAENLQASLGGAVRVSNPNTTGAFRVLGMEGAGTVFPVEQNTLLPGGAPGSSTGTPLPADLEETNRGKLLYKDYWSGSAGGYTLLPYGEEAPEDQVYSYEDGSRTGPYLAGSGPGDPGGPLAVLDFALKGGEWAAADVRAPGGEYVDLSDATAISFRWRSAHNDSWSGDIELYLQAGALDEDTDGDGTLDSGSGYGDPFFPFDDAARGITLSAGAVAPDSRLVLSEDTDRNGTLQAAEPGAIFTSPELAGGAAPTDEWRTARIPLGPAERKRLSETRGARLIVYSASGATGRIVASEIAFEGTSFATRAGNDPASTVSFREVAERAPDTLPPGTPSLLEQFPESACRFHSSAPACRDGAGGADAAGTASGQRVLEVSWDNPAGSDPDWSSRDYLASVPGASYGELVFFLRAGAPELGGDGSTLTLELSGSPESSSGPGLVAAVPLPADERWHEVVIDPESETVLLRDGENGEGSVVGDLTVTGEATERLRYLSLSFRGSDSGTLYLDELHWRDPAVQLGFVTRGEVSWQRPGAILSAGSFPLLANLDLSQSAELRTADFDPAAAGASTSRLPGGNGSGGAGGATHLRSTTGLGTDLAGTRLETNADVSTQLGRPESSVLRLGHTLTVPGGEVAAGFPVSLTDSYRRSFATAQSSMYRENALDASIPGVLEVRGKTTSTLSAGDISQQWQAGATGPWEPHSLSVDMLLAQEAGPYGLPEAGYFGSWIDAYELLAPFRAETVEQLHAEFQARATAAWSPVSLSVETNAELTNPGELGTRQTDSGDLSISLPVSLGTGSGEWNVTPEISRRFRHTVPREASARFDAGFAVYFGDLGRRPYAFRTVPVAELFDSRTAELFAGATDGLSDAQYNPAVGLAVERPGGSRITDLLLPQSATTTLSRELTRDGDATRDTRSFELALTTLAINLFGRQGSYPVFDFYRSDELSTDYELRITREPARQDTDVDTQVTSVVRLFGAEQREATLETTARYTRQDQPDYSAASAFTFAWRTAISDDPILPALQLAGERDGYFSHTERLRVNVEALGLDRVESGFTVSLGHESALELPERGSIRVYAGFGIGREYGEQGDGDQTILGAQAGIEGTFEF